MKNVFQIEGITKEEFLEHLKSLAPKSPPVITDKRPEKNIKLFTTDETAKLLKISKRSLMNKIKERKIDFFKDGVIRFTEKNIQDYINNNQNSKK